MPGLFYEEFEPGAVFEHQTRMTRRLDRLRHDHVVERIIRIVGKVGVGMKMRMVFRVKERDPQRGFVRYFWKAAPASGPAQAEA